MFPMSERTVCSTRVHHPGRTTGLSSRPIQESETIEDVGIFVNLIVIVRSQCTRDIGAFRNISAVRERDRL